MTLLTSCFSDKFCQSRFFSCCIIFVNDIVLTCFVDQRICFNKKFLCIFLFCNCFLKLFYRFFHSELVKQVYFSQLNRSTVSFFRCFFNRHSVYGMIIKYFSGSEGGARTHDPVVNSHLLYRWATSDQRVPGRIYICESKSRYFVVPGTGLEPAHRRYCVLSAACLPVPPPRHIPLGNLAWPVWSETALGS